MKYLLISVTRSELDIEVAYFDTLEDANRQMLEEVMDCGRFSSMDEFEEAVEADEAGYAEGNDAWCESHYNGTVQWRIVAGDCSANTEAKPKSA